MIELSLEELKKAILENVEEEMWRDFINSEGYSYYGEDEEGFEKAKAFLESELKFAFLDSERSSDDDHDGYTWRWKFGDRIFQADGYYSSYDGSQLDDAMDFYEVKPVEKTITVYERI